VADGFPGGPSSQCTDQARVVDVITSELFRVPTTIDRHGKRLALVNGRFDLGFPPPFGPGAPPGTDFDVVQIRP
jgi:hypothetical protein